MTVNQTRDEQIRPGTGTGFSVLVLSVPSSSLNQTPTKLFEWAQQEYDKRNICFDTVKKKDEYQ
ncbi:hypothetical protein Hanom_Chr03g00182951 [Helianthus anomalus]